MVAKGHPGGGFYDLFVFCYEFSIHLNPQNFTYEAIFLPVGNIIITDAGIYQCAKTKYQGN